MKRFLFSLIFALCLCSCDLIQDQYYIVIAVDTENSDVVFVKDPIEPGKNHFETTVDSIIYLYYFLLPETNKKIDIQNVYSSNPDIVAIETIDETSKTIKAVALAPGEAKIHIKTNKYGSNTSLKIIVF